MKVLKLNVIRQKEMYQISYVKKYVVIGRFQNHHKFSILLFSQLCFDKEII